MILRTIFDTQENLPNEWLLERLRLHRDRLLAQSDWAMMPDAPTDKTAWAAYRQALRDLPNGWEPCETIDFPARPDEPAVTVVAEPSVTDAG